MDNANDCRARALEADTAGAASLLPNQRACFERSAAAWRERADMLEAMGRTTTNRRLREMGEAADPGGFIRVSHR